MVSLAKLLRAMLEHGGTDMHITSGSPPVFRVHGRLSRIKAMKPFTPGETKELCYSVLTDYQKAQFEEKQELDFSVSIRSLARFRGNLFYQRGSVSGAFRHIPFDIPKIETLGLPDAVETLLEKPKGLILCTGPAGAGKTTTLAAMVETINLKKHQHIITIEDPIEFVYTHKKSLINQREVGSDTKQFKNALRSALREDPDVVMVGEMRDKETIETALLLAETGQLVLSTLHTNSAHQTISRILNVFASDKQPQVRTQLATVLEGVISQALLERADRKGRVLACEIMIPNSSIRALIRENKLHQLLTAMQAGQDASGMVTFNQTLMALVKRGIITVDTALAKTPEQEGLIKMLSEYERSAA